MTDGAGEDSLYTSGAYRVASYDPTLLPLLSASDQDPPGRFDDPRREYRVRYVARSLRGCLVESMAQWRPSSSEVVRIARSVVRSDRDIVTEWHVPAVPEAWLDRQRKVRLRAVQGSDIFDVSSKLAELATCSVVATEVASQLGPDYQLDEAALMLGGSRGRRISQAVAAEVYERDPRPDALFFHSRFDLSEDCWAIFDDVKVEFLTEPRYLDRSSLEDCDAARGAAERHGLSLPLAWNRGDEA